MDSVFDQSFKISVMWLYFENDILGYVCNARSNHFDHKTVGVFGLDMAGSNTNGLKTQWLQI